MKRQVVRHDGPVRRLSLSGRVAGVIAAASVTFIVLVVLLGLAYLAMTGALIGDMPAD
ncbi:hypothetical protein GCM10020369_00110 [Cryptosporangium minutisporangium]|uniref:Uncharacterized protein n=1 Tax=Cryptosporangium minutisporangium TaxID=113569 RepID=A0ABP6SPG2_9ACTN